jgi:hypothetical protein
MRIIIAAAASLFLVAACSSKSNVSVTSGGSGTVQTTSRSEPIFYNGQHYTIDFAYDKARGLFDIQVAGTSLAMTPKDEKAATAIATSALGHFACPSKLSGRLVGQPRYSAGRWSLQVACA